MTIRPASPVDIPEIVTMAERFVASGPYRAVLTLDPARVTDAAVRLVGAEDGVVLVAQDAGGELFGMLALMRYDHPMTGERIVTEFAWWVDPGRRGTAGIRLLKAGEAWSRAQGAVGLQMVAPDARVGAFYESVGYQAVETAYFLRF